MKCDICQTHRYANTKKPMLSKAIPEKPTANCSNRSLVLELRGLHHHVITSAATLKLNACITLPQLQLSTELKQCSLDRAYQKKLTVITGHAVFHGNSSSSQNHGASSTSFRAPTIPRAAGWPKRLSKLQSGFSQRPKKTRKTYTSVYCSTGILLSTA